MFRRIALFALVVAILHAVFLLTGCATTTYTHQDKVRNGDLRETRVDAVRTRYPVVLRHLRSQNSPSDSFSVVVSPAVHPAELPADPTLFRILNGTLIINEPGSFGYLFGTRPSAVTDNTDASSDMTIAIVLIGETYERFYLLEGGPLRIKQRANKDNCVKLTDQFTYVQIDVGENGDQWQKGDVLDIPDEGDDDQGIRAVVESILQIVGPEQVPIVLLP